MRNIECAEKVDFSKIYSRVLQIAMTQKLSNAKMPKSIFVFAYKEFDKASKNDWALDYKDAWNNYKKRGYATVPQLVFWNLIKDSVAALEVIGSPVKFHNAGIIITGFSNTLLRLRLTPNAEDVMKWAVSTEELRSLFIMD
ncbi:PREDICTED: LOW QUALITY PROTEIN [Prunus dulcis]|uniref:PREDICTED: LOW QUALITY PROTEIN n=1 Tax=Prunus dulcis TaxID=3755 RepID=A0A5E4ERI9_PRUDU|nr:PREDICTED: LOW QUALITY PROTEIN [Prunus dulcis]